MKKIKNLTFILLGITALAGLAPALIPTTTQGRSEASTNDVNVAGPPTGARNAGLAGPATVIVGNPAGNPVWVRGVNDARQPFHESVVLNLGVDDSNESGFIFVPPGKRLVIEYASADALMPVGQRMKIFIRTTLSGNPRDHFLVLYRQGAMSGFDNLTAGQEVRLYADPGTSVTIQAVRLASTGSGMTAKVTISGYFVDVP